MTAIPPLSTLAADQRMIRDWADRSLPVENVAQRRTELLAEAMRIVQQAIEHEPALKEAPPAAEPP